MKRNFLALVCTIFLFSSKAQITKGNWLVGGTGNISRQQEKLLGADVKSTSIELNPDLGYFIVDKLAIGLQPGFGYVDQKTSTYHSYTTAWAVGPFARYYFLSVENRTNLFAQSAYQYFKSSVGGGDNTFLFSGDPVIFFNTSAGLEITANYKIFKQGNTENSSKTFS